jgi:hypothetical protein
MKRLFLGFPLYWRVGLDELTKKMSGKIEEKKRKEEHMTDEACHLRLKNCAGTRRCSLVLRPHETKEKLDSSESEVVKISESFVRVINFNPNEVRNETDTT